MTLTTGARCAIFALLYMMSCAPSARARPADVSTKKDHAMAPEIQCSAVPAGEGRVLVRYEIHNAGHETIHLINSKRLPYQIADGTTLAIVYGVTPPDPNVLYNMIEIPLSRPLAPGERITGEQALPLRALRDHYGERPVPAALQHGTIKVRCDVGWGTTPITETSRQAMSIHKLLAWQQIASAAPIAVVLP